LHGPYSRTTLVVSRYHVVKQKFLNLVVKRGAHHRYAQPGISKKHRGARQCQPSTVRSPISLVQIDQLWVLTAAKLAKALSHTRGPQRGTNYTRVHRSRGQLSRLQGPDFRKIL